MGLDLLATNGLCCCRGMVSPGRGRWAKPLPEHAHDSFNAQAEPSDRTQRALSANDTVAEFLPQVRTALKSSFLAKRRFTIVLGTTINSPLEAN